jgi:eukaryotic-like serine/threonine-protein kinase
MLSAMNHRHPTSSASGNLRPKACRSCARTSKGENLTQLVARSGPLLPSRAAFLVRQAARALSEAHQRGIIHRDVKPDNLFVTCVGGEDDFVKVLDFGIARVLADDGTLTGTALVGTPGYIAPEVLHGAEASARSDIYGLGAVLYFMISGHPPCESADGDSWNLRRTLVPASVKQGKGLAAELEAIAMRCLARDPNARFGSTREMVEALDAWAKLPAWTEAEAVATSSLSIARA